MSGAKEINRLKTMKISPVMKKGNGLVFLSS
jgi:hypothetical protein